MLNCFRYFKWYICCCFFTPFSFLFQVSVHNETIRENYIPRDQYQTELSSLQVIWLFLSISSEANTVWRIGELSYSCWHQCWCQCNTYVRFPYKFFYLNNHWRYSPETSHMSQCHNCRSPSKTHNSVRIFTELFPFLNFENSWLRFCLSSSSPTNTEGIHLKLHTWLQDHNSRSLTKSHNSCLICLLNYSCFWT